MDNQGDYKDLLEKTSKFARMGSWKVDLLEEKMYWCPITREIHEVPEDYECSFSKAIEFYRDESSRKVILDAFDNAVENGQEYNVKVKIVTAKNNEKWVRAIGIPIFENGNCIKVYGLFQDIDKQERQNEELRTQMSLLNDMFLNSQMGIAFSRMNGKFFKINSGLCNILGYTEDELLKKSFKDITHPDDLKSTIAYVRDIREGKKNHHTTEKKYLHKSGKTIYVYLHLSLIKDSNNKPLHFLAQVLDLTPQHELNKKLKSFLNVTTDQNKRLLNFAHIVSHNLRSHSSNLQMLLNLLKIENPELQENQMVEMIGQSVENLNETIQHLNEVVMIQTSDKKNVKNLCLYKYVNQTIESILGDIKNSEVQIDNRIPTKLEIKFVPAYLQSVLLNLLTNAIKYQSDKRKLKIELFTEETKKYTILNVKDNGLGIDLEAHGSSIFGMYKTFHVHEDSRGIGLFITKNQIEAMNGKILVESQEDKGTTFKVYFKNEL